MKYSGSSTYLSALTTANQFDTPMTHSYTTPVGITQERAKTYLYQGNTNLGKQKPATKP